MFSGEARERIESELRTEVIQYLWKMTKLIDVAVCKPARGLPK